MIWPNKSTLSLKLIIRIVLIHLNSVQLIKQCKLMRKVNKNEYRNFGGIALCLPKLFSTLTACCLHSSLYFCLIFVWPTNTNTYLTSTNLDVDFSHVKTCEGIAPCLYFSLCVVRSISIQWGVILGPLCPRCSVSTGDTWWPWSSLTNDSLSLIRTVLLSSDASLGWLSMSLSQQSWT